MRIAYLADPGTGNGFYRGIGPMYALEQLRGHDVRRLPVADERAAGELMREIDLLFVHRYCDDHARSLVRAAKKAGAAVAWDNDDDMGASPKGSADYRHFGGINWERRLAEMRQIFRVADLVTSPSATLGERLRSVGASQVATIENFVPDQFIMPARGPRDGVTVGWIAGLEHQADVERLSIRDALQRLLDERAEVRVVTFGLRLGLHGDRYRHVDVVPLLELTKEAAAFDIGIAPISDISMNQARSNVKLKEYAAAGACWLASPIGPYAGMGEKQGGRLVPDDQWHQQLTRLIDKPRERQKLTKRAAKWVAGETLTKHVGTWETLLAEAVQRARAAVPA